MSLQRRLLLYLLVCAPLVWSIGMLVSVSRARHEVNELYDSGCHWCGLTQTSFGPDGQPVRPDICQGERSCCQH